MLRIEQRSRMIREYLARFTAYVHLSNGESKNDINHDAEAFYCGLLNIVLSDNKHWGYRDKTVNLVDMNAIRQNYPAIDLGDTENRLAVQVSSTEDREKVRSTLIKFFERNMDAEFDRLIMLIIGSRDSYIRKFDVKPGFDFQIERDVWDTKRLGKEIGRLTPQRQQMVLEYLQDQFEDRGISTVSLYLPPSSALGDGFVGREDKLDEIEQKLRNKVKPIVLSGLGGMGKTELAVRFGLNYEDGNVYFVRFSESFTATVTAMFRGVCPQPQDPPPEAEQYNAVMSLLAKCGEKDILIIDNVDADSGTLRDLMKDAAYKALNAMKLRLILTTRFDEARSVGVRPMPKETLYEIFKKHGASLEESQMNDLIDAVNGHTLTIDLMARILNGKSWRKVTPETLLNDLRTNALPSANYKKITSDYNQSEDQAQIYQHLSVVFDATHIPEDAKNVLRCATLLPDGGMNGEYFHDALTEEQQQAFEALIDHGWLNAEDGLLTIHPVIRLVCQEELKPNEESCGAFLDALWGQLDVREYNRVKFAQMSDVFAGAMEIDGCPEKKAEWLNHSGRLLLDLMESRKCAALYEKHIPDLEKQIPARPALATAYNNVGSTYSALGDHKKALEYQLKALAIREKVLPPEHPDLAISYNNVGSTYGNLGSHNKALEYQLKALAIQEKVLPRSHPHLATSYNNVGLTYGELGGHNKALEYQLKALAIREKVLPPEHPDLAISYGNVGTTYGAMGEYEKQLEYEKKTLRIFKQALQDNHPYLGQAYNNIGITYFRLKNYPLALEYLEKALAILEKSLPAGHPHTESTRRSIEALRTWM